MKGPTALFAPVAIPSLQLLCTPPPTLLLKALAPAAQKGCTRAAGLLFVPRWVPGVLRKALAQTPGPAVGAGTHRFDGGDKIRCEVQNLRKRVLSNLTRIPLVSNYLGRWSTSTFNLAENHTIDAAVTIDPTLETPFSDNQRFLQWRSWQFST